MIPLNHDFPRDVAQALLRADAGTRPSSYPCSSVFICVHLWPIFFGGVFMIAIFDYDATDRTCSLFRDCQRVTETQRKPKGPSLWPPQTLCSRLVFFLTPCLCVSVVNNLPGVPQ